ncbi:MAG: ankyrin repeat domain-containing protein [Acidiferrobacterales bacterium]
MFIHPLPADLFKIYLARIIPQVISILFLIFIISGQVYANEKLPLLEAAKGGNQELVISLINSGEDVNQADDSGYTPLMWAARYNYLEISRILVSADARIRIKNNAGLDAIQLAVRFDNYKIVRFLENSYSPGKEIFKKQNNVKSATPAVVSDKNQDGYLDEVVTGKLLTGYDKNTVILALKKCDQDKQYKTLSAWWGFYKNKWRQSKKVNDSVVFSNRRGYSIEINFSSENNQVVMLVGYRYKQGRLDILKRIAGDTKTIYEFLCEVPETTDRLLIDENEYDDEIIFKTAACENKPDVRLAVPLINLRKNNWKNIRIHNKEYISAEYNDGLMHRKVVIKYFDDWKYGRIYLSSDAKNSKLEPEVLEKQLEKQKEKLKKDIARSYKSFCRI